MKPFRAFLTFVWLVLALIATSHAATGYEMACHVGGVKHHAPPADADVMPCCSQPVVIAEPEPAILPAGQFEPARLFPLPVPPLHGLAVAAEPRPPKLS